MKKTSIKTIIRTIRFKFLMVAAAAVAIIFSFHIILSQFNTTDPEPHIKHIDIRLTRKFAAFTVHVETGIFIRNFSHFSMVENKFVTDMVVWFLFNPTETTVDIIDKFSFENGRILEKSPPDIKILDGKTFVKYNVVAELKSNLEYHNFPLEDHRLSIVLTNNFVTPYEVMFEVLSTDFVVAPTIFVANWYVKKLSTNFGIDEDLLNQIDKTKKIAYSKAAFTIDFAKAGIRKAFIIFVPIFIVFFFSIFSLILTLANIIGRTTLIVSALSALLGYRFVIEGMMPKVGYFTTTDYVYIILLIFSFIIFIFNVMITRRFNIFAKNERLNKANIEQLRIIKDISFILITVISTTIICATILR